MKIHQVLPTVLSLGLLLLSAAGPAHAAFVHPGCLSDSTDISRMQTQVNAGAHPWIDDWNNLQASTFASNTRTANPVADVVRGCSTTCTENYTSIMQDAATAYQNALEYSVTGNVAYANCAVNIMNAWARTLTTIDTCCSDHFLLAGIQGYQFASAGELLRNYSGWAAADFTAYQNWMMNVWYPVNHDFLTNHNAACITHYWTNWDACNMASMICIGVLCDNQTVFNEAVNYFKTGTGNGAITQAVYHDFGPGLGQWQESGRDQGHTMLGVGLLGYVCEVAWKQGVDLYGYVDPTTGKTFIDGMEYVAKYNVDTNNSVPYTTLTTCDSTETQTVISSNGRSVSTQRNYWDMLDAAYVRKNVAMTYTPLMAAGLRPDHGGGYGSTGASWAFDMVGFSTLTHYLTSMATTSTLPAAGTGLTARAGDTQAFLSWTGGSGATSYTIERGTTSGGPYSPIASVTGTSYTDNLLTNGTAYYYVVLSANSAGAGRATGEAGATPVASANAPAAPTGVTATAASQTQINLTWTASSGAVSYNVQRSTTNGGPYTTIMSQVTQPNYSDYGLNAATTYYYVIQAVNSAGTSVNSGQASATTQGSTATPAAPTGLVASAGNAQVGLSWTASSGATSYNVKRATVSGGPYTTVASPTSASYVDNSTANGTTYYYVVSAVNANGESANSAEANATPQAITWTDVDVGSVTVAGSGAESAGVYTVKGEGTDMGGTADAFNLMYETLNGDGTMVARLSNVQFGSGTSGKIGLDIRASTASGDQSVALLLDEGLGYPRLAYRASNGGSTTWVNGPTGKTLPMWFKLQRSGSTFTGYTSNDGSTWTTIGSASVTMPTSVLVGFAVCSRSAGYLDTATYDCVNAPVSTTTVPAAPTGLTATAASSSQINLSWTASSGATSYNVLRSTTSGGPYTAVATGVTSTTYSNTGLSASTTYYYVVQAVNSAGTSGNSAEASATTQAATAPAAPTSLAASASKTAGKIKLTWTQSTSANISNNKVYRSTTSGGPYSLVTTIAATTTYTDSGLTSGATYYYIVTAVNSSGLESPNSNQASATSK